ncbi:hypothetical protein AMTR_s00095p00143560 [Amborella trichopoda]|uniref:Uncharacterized protein n=1 Tax=Amborella trichopoda TaxID=13333 RepID=W1NRN5_AMBTC|nr:hypothetical protein AMTR_s00095p00143560 [Amborella trichopoda]
MEEYPITIDKYRREMVREIVELQRLMKEYFSLGSSASGADIEASHKFSSTSLASSEVDLQENILIRFREALRSSRVAVKHRLRGTFMKSRVSADSIPVLLPNEVFSLVQSINITSCGNMIH